MSCNRSDGLREVALIPWPRVVIQLPGAVELSGQGSASSCEVSKEIRRGLSPSLIGESTYLSTPVRVHDRSPLEALPIPDPGSSGNKVRPLSILAGLKGGSVANQGYALVLDQGAVQVSADSQAGRLYGIHTASQLLTTRPPSGRLPRLFIYDEPDLAVRGVHACYHLVTESMPVLAPNLTALMQRVELMGHYKANLLLLELESLFPYQEHANLACRLSFARDELLSLAELCRANRIEILPLIQCLGHVYNVLRHPEYSHLRETPRTTQQYCATNPAVKDFYMQLVDEVIALFPDIRGFHVGGDESRRLGICDRCGREVEKNGVAGLYGTHIGEICRRLLAKGLTPYVWADMIEQLPEGARYLPKGTVLVYWNYDLLDWPTEPGLERIIGTGFDVVTASAARWYNHNQTMFLFTRSTRGIGVLTRETQRHGLGGTIVTDWTKTVPHELSLISLAYGMSEAWNPSLSLADYERAFGRLTHGLPMEAAGEMAAVYRMIEDPFPLCEDFQAFWIDRLDRYDISGATLREKRARALSQDNAENTLAQLERALERGTEALGITDRLASCCTSMQREVEVLRLSVLTHIHKARVGIALIHSTRLLRYPLRDDAGERDRVAEELRSLLAEWETLAARTRETLLPGSFPESVEEALKIKFEPELKTRLECYLQLLEQGETLQNMGTI